MLSADNAESWKTVRPVSSKYASDVVPFEAEAAAKKSATSSKQGGKSLELD